MRCFSAKASAVFGPFACKEARWIPDSTHCSGAWDARLQHSTLKLHNYWQDTPHRISINHFSHLQTSAPSGLHTHAHTSYTQESLRSWAQVTLRRCVEFFGEEYCCFRLQQEQEIMTMFSGIECARKSWEYIESAAMEILGIKTGVTFTCADTLLSFRYALFMCKDLQSINMLEWVCTLLSH